ncbi:MAG: hypothetical protein KGH65_05615 [Candidatus Micrarchaeota archaeon]|nr:hypothetical protein [Candidatus Micrarchaeota archaeon]
MEAEAEVIRGARAAELLASPIFIEAREHITEGIKAQMLAVPLSDQTMHTRLVTTLQLWNSLEKYIQQVADTGRMAQFQVAEQERKRSWWPRSP